MDCIHYLLIYYKNYFSTNFIEQNIFFTFN